MITNLLLKSFLVIGTFSVASAFHASGKTASSCFHRIQNANRCFKQSALRAEAAEAGYISGVESYIAENYPIFSSLLLSMNDEVQKELRKESAFTLFVPNDEAFEKLGEKKIEQLQDIRNSETTEKVAAYHFVNEPVSADELFASGGVITLGGEVPVGRSVSGGFFGIGGKEDGGSTVGNANVVQSFYIGYSIIHEVDDLISPQLLWRYMDQLRIPGSK